MERSEIEQSILAASRVMKKDAATNCYNSSDVENLLKTWRDLADYYEVNSDTSIGVEMVREYLDWLSTFATIWHDEKRSEECRKIANEAVHDLEWYMDNITKAVEQKIYPDY